VLRFGGYRNPAAKKRAIVAIAHTLAVVIWHVLATGRPYTDLGPDFYTGLPRVFRTTELVLFHAASGRFRYSSRASCGVLYPSAEWRRVRLYRSSMYRAMSSRAFFLVG